MDLKRIKIRCTEPGDDLAIAQIIRENLRKYHLNIPGTAYFDSELNHLNQYYLQKMKKRVYFIAESEAGEVAGGIDQQLLETVENYAKSNRIRCLYLETHSNLREAVCLYEKNGHHQISKHITLQRWKCRICIFS